jgi:multidrug efflux pump subunit AcrA (membrane-fusion protein)
MAALGLAGALLLFAPIWPDFVSGPFVLESGHRAVVRAQVPGEVVQVLASEGQQVSSGVPLLRLRNLQLESAATQAAADLKLASARAIDANLNYGDFGAAEHERQELLQRQQSLAQQVAELQVASPDAGVVATPRLHDLLGKYLTAGATVAEVADLSTMTARIFVPEFGVRDLRLGERVRLQVRSAVLPINGKLRWVGPASSPVEPGFVQKEQLEGLHPPHYYVAKVDVANHGELREGMTGTAKIFVRRRSLAAFAGRFARDLVERRVW